MLAEQIIRNTYKGGTERTASLVYSFVDAVNNQGHSTKNELTETLIIGLNHNLPDNIYLPHQEQNNAPQGEKCILFNTTFKNIFYTTCTSENNKNKKTFLVLDFGDNNKNLKICFIPEYAPSREQLTETLKTFIDNL